MKFHDFTLESYEVADKGETITLKLCYEQSIDNVEKSIIKFSHVALYNFVHISDTIILDIEEVNLENLVLKWKDEIIEWNRMYCVKYWEDNLNSYINTLKEKGFKAWEISSSIGFCGFIIARNISNSS